ncbi:MAG: glycosyltransferase [Pirellulales bacterium]
MSESWPPITVVIPAYNLQNYIADAILCAVNQDYPGSVQIVVLDDGSSDQTLAVATSTAKQVENVSVHHQSNQGRVGARNRLLQLAETELVAWLDGDDIAPPDWIRQQFELMQNDEEIVAVSGQGYAMTHDRLPIGPIPRPCSPEVIAQTHLKGKSNAFFQSCTLTRRSSILKSGSYRKNYPAAEDYDLWLRLEQIGKLANHTECHLYYRVHSTSANATVGAQQRQQGFQCCNEARVARGLEPLEPQREPEIPPPRKDDWNRRMFWINVALKAGNPWTASMLTYSALKAHPRSLWLWLFLLVGLSDSILFGGNRTERFRAGTKAQIGALPNLSFYRLGRRFYRWLNRKRH